MSANPAPASAPFIWKARIYWEDTDGGGIVYYANYLKFLERARTEWLRSCGHVQSRLLAEQGIAFAVAGLEIDYVKPARLDDELSITCRARRDGAVVLFEQEIYRATPEDLLVRATVKVVSIDLTNAKPRRLPDFLLKELAAT